MRKISLLILFLMLFAVNICSADVLVVFDPGTQEVYSISDKADAVVPDGFKTGSLPGKAEEYQRDTKDYKFVDGRLSLNTERIKERDRIIANDLEKIAEYTAVEKEMRRMAYENLKAGGFKFKHITDDTFK